MSRNSQIVKGLLALQQRSVSRRGLANRPWDASNPTAYWTGRASAYAERPPPPSNAWLLHPWLPIDIRVPIFVGVFGTAALLYLDRTHRFEPAKEQARAAWKSVQPYVETVRDYAQSALEASRAIVSDSAGGRSTSPSTPPQPGSAPSSIGSQGPELPNDDPQPPPTAPPAPAASASDATSATDAAAASGANRADEPQTRVDGKLLNDVVTEALTGRAAPQPPADGSDAAAAAARTGPTLQREQQQAQQREKSPQEVTEEALADTAAIAADIERAASGLESSSAQQRASAATSPLQDSRRPLQGSLQTRLGGRFNDDVVLETAGVLGLSENISSAQLLEQASARGLTPPEAQLEAAYRQALADTESFKDVLHKVQEHHAAALQEARGDSDYWAEQARKCVALSEAVQQRTAVILQRQHELSEQAHERALATQEVELAVKFEAEANRERLARHAEIDELRNVTVQAQVALGQQSVAAAMGRRAHAATAAVTSLAAALLTGTPVTAARATLATVAADDAVVEAAMRSLPADDAPVASAAALQAQWPAAQRGLRMAAALQHDGEPGLLSAALANLAARLKISETAGVQLTGRTRTLDVQLADLDAAVAAADTPRAAALLEGLAPLVQRDHTAAAFADAVRTRSLAEQAALLLFAHASVMAQAAS